MTLRRKILYALATLVLLLVCLELGLRVWTPELMNYSVSFRRATYCSRLNRSNLLPNANEHVFFHHSDGSVFYDFKIVGDVDGIRCSAETIPLESRRDDAGGRKILHCIGDSYTFGWGVEHEESYPYQLSQLLGDDYLVLNLGWPSYGLLPAADKSEQLEKKYPPDVLVYMFSIDDVGNDDQSVELSKESDFRFAMQRLSHLAYQHVYSCSILNAFVGRAWLEQFDMEMYLTTHDDNAGARTTYRNLFRVLASSARVPEMATFQKLVELNDRCRARGIRLIVVTLLVDEWNTRLGRVCYDHGIEMIHFIPCKRWMLRDLHLNPEGNKQLARVLFHEAFATDISREAVRHYPEAPWSLFVNEGNEATLSHEGEDGSIARVEIDRLVEGPSWAIHLSRGIGDVVAEREYHVSFRARTEQPRTIEAQVKMAVPPYDAWGLDQRIAISSNGESFEFTFRATGSGKGMIVFNLGQDSAPVEIFDFQWTPSP